MPPSAKKRSVQKSPAARKPAAKTRSVSKSAAARTAEDAKSAISEAMRELAAPKDLAAPKETVALAPAAVTLSEPEIAVDRRPPEQRLSGRRTSSKTMPAGTDHAVSGTGARRLRTKDVTSFLRQLIMLLEAGTPMLKSLKSLETRGERQSIRTMVANITSYVEAGNPLWQAFARESFTPVDVNLIKASEASGTLTTVLRRIVEYREERELMRKRIQTAMVYPVALIIVGFGVLVVIAKFVIPPFVDIFNQMKVEVSGYTKFVIDVFNFIGAWWWLIALVIVGLVFALWLLRKNPLWRVATDRLRVSLPIIGPIARKTAVADFCRTFGLMLRSGLSMMVTLDLCRNSMSNKAYVDAIQDMRDSVERGEGLEKSLRAAEKKGLFPGVVVDMLITGEETGSLDVISEQIAETYEEELKITFATLGEVLLPVVVVVLGGFVIAIALALFSPIVQLINAVSAGGV